LSAALQKYAPKFLRVPYFTTGSTCGYINHAPSEHSPAISVFHPT